MFDYKDANYEKFQNPQTGHKKLCPLLLSSFISESFAEQRASKISDLIECNGNNCAWYDGKYGRCAVLSQACKK